MSEITTYADEDGQRSLDDSGLSEIFRPDLKVSRKNLSFHIS